MSTPHSDQASRLTTEEYLAAAPDAFGGIEVVEGLVIYDMAQTELHSLVMRRLAAALENARPAAGPCYRVSTDVAVRFRDSANSSLDHQLNVRYPDIIVRDCEPYDVSTIRDHIQLIVEVTSDSTFETDTTPKRVQYAAAGIPGYLVMHFDKDWSKISEIEECQRPPRSCPAKTPCSSWPHGSAKRSVNSSIGTGFWPGAAISAAVIVTSPFLTA